MLEIYLSGVMLVWVVAFLCNRYFNYENSVDRVLWLSIFSYFEVLLFILSIISDTNIGKKFNDWFERGGRNGK